MTSIEQKELSSDKDICIIALSGAIIGVRSGGGPGLPYILKALFPIGDQYASFLVDSNSDAESGYFFRSSIPKSSGTSVDSGYFLNEGYKTVSGVIFCSRGIGNTPELLGSNFLLIHNPLATIRLPPGLLSRGAEYRAVLVDDKFRFDVERFHEF